MPRIFNMRDAGERRAGLQAAAAALQAGRLVGVPTETVYGLAADATNARAVAAVFAAKGRPRFNPLIVHVPSQDAARRIAVFDEPARRLADVLWPGPLTLVLPLRPEARIADLATAGLPTVAVRVPAHPVALDLLRLAGLPLAAPSANRSGHVSATTAAHVLADLGERVAVILDAGPAPMGVESSVVSIRDDRAVLLRPGAVPRERIEGILGQALRPADEAPDRPTGPGMLASHYAPSVALRLGASAVRSGEALLAFGPSLPPGSEEAAAIRNLSAKGDLAEAAAGLFAALRDLDAIGHPVAVMPIPDHGLGEAINDRLRRAAVPRAPAAG